MFTGTGFESLRTALQGGYWTRREGLRYAEGVIWRAASRWFGTGM
jgi:hypothetical protein